MVVTFDSLSPDPGTYTKIAEGRYRTVYRVDNSTVLKVLNSSVSKCYGPLSVNFPSNLYTRFKFGITDFNEFEIRAYNAFILRVPQELKGHFAHIHAAGRYNGKSASLSELVTGPDGNPASSLARLGHVDDPSFWRRIGLMEEFIMDEGIFLFGISGENVVARGDPNGLSPVMVDHKRYGRRTYPFQMLQTQSRMQGKLKRSFVHLRERYGT